MTVTAALPAVVLLALVLAVVRRVTYGEDLRTGGAE